jgi:hypothetical protein
LIISANKDSVNTISRAVSFVEHFVGRNFLLFAPLPWTKEISCQLDSQSKTDKLDRQLNEADRQKGNEYQSLAKKRLSLCSFIHISASQTKIKRMSFRSARRRNRKLPDSAYRNSHVIASIVNVKMSSSMQALTTSHATQQHLRTFFACVFSFC